MIVKLSWEGGRKVKQIGGGEGPSHGGKVHGKVGRKEQAWPIAGTLGRIIGEMARGKRGKVQVEDCISGLNHEILGELEKLAGGLARVMIGAPSK